MMVRLENPRSSLSSEIVRNIGPSGFLSPHQVRYSIPITRAAAVRRASLRRAWKASFFRSWYGDLSAMGAAVRDAQFTAHGRFECLEFAGDNLLGYAFPPQASAKAS